MSKLIVFDVDGTILDSFGLYEKVLVEYSRDNGLPQPCVATIRHGYGDPLAHDFGWGVSREEQVRHLNASYDLNDRYTLSGAPHYTPALFDGVEETLGRLKNLGHTLALVTSKSEVPLLHLLEHHGVKELFSAHRTFDDITRRKEREKPQPDMLHSVMRELKFTPDNTVMVGDTTMDIRMGRAAATHTIGVTWGVHPKDHLLDAGAHHIVETAFDDVAQAVKKIFS
jgi:phosphoglycolate phosphatase